MNYERLLIRCRIGLLPLVLLLATSTRCAADNAEDKNSSEDVGRRFLREAPGEWATYLEKFNGFEMIVRGEETLYMHGQARQEWSCRTTIGNDGMRLLQEELPSEGRPKFLRLNGRNPKYLFELRQSHDQAHWYISGLEPVAGGRVDAANETRLTRDGNIGGLRVFGRSVLTNVVLEPRFRIRQASVGHSAGQETVELDLEYESETQYEHKVRGTFIFDPNRAWLLRKADFELQQSLEPHRAHFYVENEIGERADGVPFVTKESTKVCLEDGTLLREETRVFEGRPVDAPEEMFMLANFGFPEPDLRSPSEARLWTTLIASLIILLCVVIMFVRRRGKSSTLPL